MSYVAVKGGEQAIKNAEQLLQSLSEAPEAAPLLDALGARRDKHAREYKFGLAGTDGRSSRCGHAST